MYSTRNREGAPVATPPTWEELAKMHGPAEFTVPNLPLRLSPMRHDPWKGFFATRQRLTQTLLSAAERFAYPTVRAAMR